MASVNKELPRSQFVLYACVDWLQRLAHIGNIAPITPTTFDPTDAASAWLLQQRRPDTYTTHTNP